MSEASEKVSGIKHIPIFPLPLVMLPNEILPLHIFEDQYRQMLKDVEEEQKLFGISYFEPKESFIERPPVGSVGCVAEIRESETLPDGRSNILTQGVIRYRLLDYVGSGDPYLVGDVVFFEDEIEDEAIMEAAADTAFSLFERIAHAAFRLSGNRGRFPEIERTDPQRMSFLITAAFNFDHELKYSLLEMTSTSERLEKLSGILSQLVTQMEENAETQKVAQRNGHSNKKIDL